VVVVSAASVGERGIWTLLCAPCRVIIVALHIPTKNSWNARGVAKDTAQDPLVLKAACVTRLVLLVARQNWFTIATKKVVPLVRVNRAGITSIRTNVLNAKRTCTDPQHKSAPFVTRWKTVTTITTPHKKRGAFQSA